MLLVTKNFETTFPVLVMLLLVSARFVLVWPGLWSFCFLSILGTKRTVLLLLYAFDLVFFVVTGMTGVIMNQE